MSWAWLLVAAAVCWNLISLRALLIRAPYLNDTLGRFAISIATDTHGITGAYLERCGSRLHELLTARQDGVDALVGATSKMIAWLGGRPATHPDATVRDLERCHDQPTERPRPPGPVATNDGASTTTSYRYKRRGCFSPGRDGRRWGQSRRGG